MIGSGSFGTVYAAVQKSTGLEFAVKSIPKVPRSFPATPRYLLKLRNEVEVMQQLGASLDAVYLEVSGGTPWIYVGAGNVCPATTGY